MPLHLDVRLDAELTAVPDAVRELEEAGFAGVFTYEGPRDPFLLLALAATSSRSLAVYTNLASALPRSPTHLAHLAHDLQRASGGRFLLGLGTQVVAHGETQAVVARPGRSASIGWTPASARCGSRCSRG